MVTSRGELLLASGRWRAVVLLNIPQFRMATGKKTMHSKESAEWACEVESLFTASEPCCGILQDDNGHLGFGCALNTLQ